MESSRVIMLLAVLLTGCATAAAQALLRSWRTTRGSPTPSIREFAPRVDGRGGQSRRRANRAVFWKGGFGGISISLRGDIVGTQCGQYVIASLLALRERNRSLVDRGTLEKEAIKSLVAIRWSEQTARSAAASCPAR